VQCAGDLGIRVRAKKYKVAQDAYRDVAATATATDTNLSCIYRDRDRDRPAPARAPESGPRGHWQALLRGTQSRSP
jgi:hypothetical protein